MTENAHLWVFAVSTMIAVASMACWCYVSVFTDRSFKINKLCYICILGLMVSAGVNFAIDYVVAGAICAFFGGVIFGETMVMSFVIRDQRSVREALAKAVDAAYERGLREERRRIKPNTDFTHVRQENTAHGAPRR